MKTLFLLYLMTLTLANGTATHHVVKRSDDENPLDAVVSKLSQDLTALSARFGALENSAGLKAVFLGELAGLADGKASLRQLTPIHFNRVFDVGDGFDQLTGVYTVRFAGVYFVNFLLLPDFPDTILVDLKMNGNLLVRCRESGTNSCSAGISVQAAAGDKFWLETTTDGSYWGGPHTFFCITLVSPGL